MGLQSVTNIEYRLAKKRMTPVGYQHRIPICKKEGWLQSVTNIEHRLAKKRMTDDSSRLPTSNTDLRKRRMAPVGYQHRIPTCKKRMNPVGYQHRIPTCKKRMNPVG